MGDTRYESPEHAPTVKCDDGSLNGPLAKVSTANLWAGLRSQLGMDQAAAFFDAAASSIRTTTRDVP